MALFLRKRRDGSNQVAQDRGFSTDPPSAHHFTPKWLTQHTADGTVSLSQGQIIIHATRGKSSKNDVVFKILRAPGAYCSHCGERIADGPAETPASAANRRAYVETCEAFTDDGRPHYEVIHHYETERA